MIENPAQLLYSLGQSVWYDNIQRRLLENGELDSMIKRGEIYGITSNPSIFQNAIANSSDYDASLKPMAWSDWKAEEIFFQLAIEDIKQAAKLFLPIYEKTNKKDGYVSLEVSPLLAHKTKATIEQAKILWERVGYPNLMIKIPATREGIPAIKEVIAAGINVNVTLIFSIERYDEVIDAFFSGLEKRVKTGKPVDSIASVASFFVSRLDTKIDGLLENIIKNEKQNSAKISGLLGKAAIANTFLAYQLFLEKFKSDRFAKLRRHNCQVQRPLWASTSSKNPAYRDVIYVEELVAENTVNTVPPKTLQAFINHGKARLSLPEKVNDSEDVLANIEKLGISISDVTRQLENEGVKSFTNAFKDLLSTINKRAKNARVGLENLGFSIQEKISEAEQNHLVDRIFQVDPLVWTSDTKLHAEIKNRLGWLDAPSKQGAFIPQLVDLVNDVRNSKLTHALLLGMGGSSLAPEVMSLINQLTMANQAKGLIFNILDSTDPDQVRAAAKLSKPENTIYIVSSKSGSTSEVSAFLNYFWTVAGKGLKNKVQDHFIAITDPGSSLEKLAHEKGFKYIFQANPNVGGRYSALIEFGLVPAALMGIDIEKFLKNADSLAQQCGPGIPGGRNPGLILGTIIGYCALQGKNKLTIITDSEFSSLGSWMEQLIAESSGKQGKGIIPVDIEPLVDPSKYGDDRVFIYVSKNGKFNNLCKKLRRHGHPVIILDVQDIYDLGAEFYRWEFAISVACSILGVNAFDQPDVQDNKTRTVEKISYYQTHGKFDEGNPICLLDGSKIYGLRTPEIQKSSSPAEVIVAFLGLVHQHDYIGINAYLPRNKKNIAKLQKLRAFIVNKTGCATTLGFGPRFLHSTGQLHKGGADNGMFIQITSDAVKDIEIPGQSFSFGALERAQALGDLEALKSRNRRVIRIHLGKDDILDLF